MIRPMDRQSGPNGVKAGSLTRPAYAVTAVEYREAESVSMDMAGAGLRGQSGRLLRAGRHTASVRIPDGEAPPREGDLLQFDSGSTHEITAIDPDGLGHLTLTLAAARPMT